MTTDATRRRLSRALGGVIGASFVLVLFAGADHPPPPGFILVVAGGFLVAAAVAGLMPRILLHWDQWGLWPTLGRLFVAGFGVGAALGAVIWLGQSSTALVAGVALLGTAAGLGTAAIGVAGRLLDSAGRRRAARKH